MEDLSLLSLKTLIKDYNEGLIEAEDFYGKEAILLEKLLNLYIACLKLDEDCFFDKYGSRMIRNPNACETLTLRETIVETLFLDSVHSQKHWLESILHILQRESNKEILNTIISNMSGVYYPVFRTIYVTLVNKENIKGLPDSQIKELRKLRRSMITRIDENAFDYQRKICLCLEVEIRLEVIQKIIVRIGRSQKKSGFTIPKNNWMIIDGINKNYKDYNLTDKSTLKKITTAVIKERNKIQNKGTVYIKNT